MTPERLRELYGDVSPKAHKKVITSFDDHCKKFISHSTFIVLATTDGDSLDVSPKGDPAGFVVIESDTTLLLPDRPGNNRLDGLMNILNNPKVAILFLIPSVNETLRVNGSAEILDDSEICDRFKIKERSPKTVLKINVDKIFLHCGKALLRSNLWMSKKWPDKRPVATLFEMIRDHAELPMNDVDQRAVDESYNNSLY